MKKIHYIHPITKEYLKTHSIETKFIGKNIPNFVEVVPPVVKNGFTRCFINDNWAYVEDNRTKKIHNINSKQIFVCDYLGVIKDGFALGEYKKSNSEIELEAKELNNSKIFAEIQELEFKQLRTIREALISNPDIDTSRLESSETEIVALRAKLI